MVFDIDSTAVPWPGLVIVISAGSIICTVLLLVMCTCCFKTKVPQYRAKLTKNVVAKEDIRRYTPEKRKFGNRDYRMHSLIFDGAPIGSGRWDDLFVTGDETVPNDLKPDKPSAHANPPDVIMHPALLRVLNKESRNITQGEAIIVPTNSVASPSRPSHPSSNLQELIKQTEDAEKGKFNNDVAPLAKFPLRREPSQEFNRDGSILYYKPRRDVTPKEHESKQKAESPAIISRDSSRSDDPITSRILETKQPRKLSRREPRKSPRLPRFNRTSGEWDNVPKPGWSVDTPPPIPSRNYSIGESDVATDCSETMPRPVIDHNLDRKPVEAERTKLNIIQESTRQSSGLSRPSSRSSGASSRNLPRSPDSGHLKRSNVKNPSPISDTVFIPNENPAYTRGSATPPGHTPRKDYRRHPDGRLLQRKDDYHLGVMSDGSFELVDEAKRTNHRNKRVDGIISDHNGQSPRHWKPGVYYRPKPFYQHLKIPEKRYSDASDYSDVMFERTNSFVRKTPADADPYFFRSRWSSAFETPADVRRQADVVSNGAKSESRDKEIAQKRLPLPSSSNDSSLDRLSRNNQRQPTQRSSRSNRAARQDIPLPEAPFPYSSRAQRRDVSPSKRTHDSHASPSKWPHESHDSRRDVSPSKRTQQSRLEASPSKRTREPRRPQPPLEGARVQESSLEIVIEQHKDDVLVSPGHQPNYPVDVAKIRRGLQQSSSEGKAKDYNLPSDRCDETTDRNSDFCHSTKSLNVPDNQKMRRASSEYGSLIDILYSYRQNVRQTRVKEKPMESRESRLKFEREKLKSKLREVLQPREMQSKNVEMVVETLLFLCETESGRDKRKHSWQRDAHSDTNARRHRSNSFEIVTPTDEKDEADFGVYDVGNWDDYARIRSHSDSRHSLVKNGANRPSASDDFAAPPATPSESTDKEFAFPTVEELDRILGQEDTPPPVPPRRHHITQSSDVIPPAVAPRKPKTPRKALPPTPDEKIPNGKNINLEQHEQFPNGKNNEHDVSEQKFDSNEPDYAKIRKKTSRKRRKSLPSRHLTESEIRWLVNSGGNADKVSKDVEQFPRGNNKIVPQSVRARDRSGAILRRRDLPSPPEPPKEATFSLDDIPVDETTDAEDIIKAVERKMSQNQLVLSHNNADQSPVKNRNSPKLHSDSEIGTWSSVTSSEIPVPPRRARLQRYDGTSPKHDDATSQSPVFLRKTYHTPPSSVDIRPRNPVAGALSPMRSVRDFQTPPASPQANHSNPIANSKKFASASNVSVTPSSTPSPKIKGRGSRSSNISVTPPLTPSPKIKARGSPFFLSPNRQRSVPHRSQPTPKKSPHHMGFIPNLARRTTKFTPNIPIMSKRLIQPTSQHEIVVPIESDRRRISRTGEIVYLPDDDDYAQPVDAVTMDAPNRIQTSQCLNRGDMSPSSPLFNLERHSFYPIVEDEDYAVPVNQTPNTLLQQRIYAKSMENIMSEYESSV